MKNKKDIVVGLAVVLLMAGVVYYGAVVSKGKKEQTAAIKEAINNGQDNDNQDSVEKVEETADDKIFKADFTLGDENAPVEMIEFSSHFCGYCIRHHQQTYPALYEKYVKTGKIKMRFVYVSPLEISEAVICAGEQGDFMKFSSLLFDKESEVLAAYQIEDSGEALVQKLTGLAKSAGLDADKMEVCLASHRNESKVQKWLDESNEKEITGTPTFVIGSQKIIGAQPLASFEAAIEAELAKVQ